MHSVSKSRRVHEPEEAGYVNNWQKRRYSQSRKHGTTNTVPSPQGDAILT